MPVVSVDYAWLNGRKEGGKTKMGIPMLVMHCRETKLTRGEVALRKGAEPYFVKVMGDIDAFTSHRNAVIKSDGESSITAIIDAVKATCNPSMGVEVSAAGDTQANGGAGRAARTAQGQA